MVWLSFTNAVLLILLWISNRFLGEASWFSMMLAYLPQILFALPAIFLLIVGIALRRWRIAAFQGLLFAVFLFALAGLKWHPSRSAGEPEFKVVTLNIQRGKHGLDGVLALIRKENPHVFCLQECDSTQDEPLIDRIRAAMKEYEVHDERGLVIGSRLPVAAFRSVPLPYGKPLIEARVRYQGQTLTVANVHLIAIFVDQYLLESPGKIPPHLRKAGREREHQLQTLLGYASQRDGLVLCGDFNAPSNSGFHRRLGGSLRDAFAWAGSGFGYTIPASFPLMRLDFVYTSSDLFPTGCEVPGEVVSDHRAVVAEIDVQRKR